MSYWVAGGIVGGAVIGAIGSNSAANTQAGAQNQATATQQYMFDTINSQEQPFMQAGYGATTSLSNLLGTGKTGKFGTDAATGLPNGYLTQTFNPTQSQLENYPGYKFALQQGGQATRNADTPGMGALSGAALKDLTSFNVGTANQYYGQYFNQFQQQQNNIFSRLSAIAGLGQNAASNTGTAGTQLGTGMAQSQAAAGASQAAGTVGAANALSGSSVPLAYILSGQGGGGGGGGGLYYGGSGTNQYGAGYGPV
jgi:hypothetical protein